MRSGRGLPTVTLKVFVMTCERQIERARPSHEELRVHNFSTMFDLLFRTTFSRAVTHMSMTRAGKITDNATKAAFGIVEGPA